MKILTTTCIALCFCICACGEPTVNVSQLTYPGRVIGHFGKPLGSRTIITGHYEAALTENPLRVTNIDGTTVTNDILISIRGRLVPSLEEEKTYSFEGYESGEFISSPTWAEPCAQQPFQFHSVFIVTKVLKPK